jgi:hypothetical protein
MQQMMNPALRDLVAAVLLLVMAVFVMAFNHRQESDQGPPQRVTAALVEVSTTGFRGRKPALRFKLAGYAADFRVSPEYFAQHLQGEIPTELRPGATAQASVDSRELHAPARPHLGPSEGIVWVRGLVVGGRVLLARQDALETGQSNEGWGIAFLLGSFGLVVYTARQWRRQRNAQA